MVVDFTHSYFLRETTACLCYKFWWEHKQRKTIICQLHVILTSHIFKNAKVVDLAHMLLNRLQSFIYISVNYAIEKIINYEASVLINPTRFLQILEIIVQEPGSAFKTFLPSIISICMEHIYPIIAEVRRKIYHYSLNYNTAD